MSAHIIREIGSPARILAFNYGPAGSLGAFDPQVYEEVFEPLPASFELVEPQTVADKLSALFLSLDDATIAGFYVVKAAVAEAVRDGRYEAAALIIQAVDVTAAPASVQAAKAQFLAILGGS